MSGGSLEATCPLCRKPFSLADLIRIIAPPAAAAAGTSVLRQAPAPAVRSTGNLSTSTSEIQDSDSPSRTRTRRVGLGNLTLTQRRDGHRVTVLQAKGPGLATIFKFCRVSIIIQVTGIGTVTPGPLRLALPGWALARLPAASARRRRQAARPAAGGVTGTAMTYDHRMTASG